MTGAVEQAPNHSLSRHHDDGAGLVEERQPISYVIPILRDLTGIY